jgi:benzoate-CoA ligase family protein
MSMVTDQPPSASPQAPPPPTGEPFNAADWLVARQATAAPSRPALTVVDSDGKASTTTYGELQSTVERVAAALVAAGIRPEERLLLVMADSRELVAAFVAALHIGAVPVPLSTMATAKDIAVVAADSCARLLIVSPEFAAAATGTAAWLPPTVVAGPTAPPGLSTWDAFLTAGAGRTAPAAQTVADSPGFWLYTSGTTGTPKGAMHRHGSLRSTAETYAADVLGIGPDDVCYSVAKIFFAYGLGNSLTFPFSVGARAVLDRARPAPDRVASIVTAQRPTLFFAGPTFYAALLSAGVPADTFSSVRLCVSAGESLPADLYRRFTERFGVEVLDGIGSTEALHIFLSNRPGRVRPGTTGEVVAGYELRLEDDDGNLVADGNPGNLYVRGESVASGYWCRTEVTRRVFRGPWLRTGDTYVRDPDGYYACLGRTDDVLKAGGIWVSPTEVETRLREHPGVEAAVVVSVPDADGLDKPVACVVRAAGQLPAEEELIHFCREGLASYKRPRRVLFLDEFPTTATGKLQRYKLREHATSVLTGERSPSGVELG